MSKLNQINIADIQNAVQEHRDVIIQFMRDLVAIPSMDSQIKDVGSRLIAWGISSAGLVRERA